MSERDYNEEQIKRHEATAKRATEHNWALAIVVWVLIPFVFILPDPYGAYATFAQLFALVLNISFGIYAIYHFRQASKWLDREIERLEREFDATVARIESDHKTKENQ